MHACNERGVADVVGRDIIGPHGQEDLVGLVQAPPGHKGSDEGRVGYHVGHAPLVRARGLLHVQENLHAHTAPLAEPLPKSVIPGLY